MPDPKEKKDPLWKRALDKVMGTVKIKEPYNPFAEKNMAKVLTREEAEAQDKQGLYEVYGKAETIKQGRRAYNRGEQLLLPSYSEQEGWYMPHPTGSPYAAAGFSDTQKTPDGYPVPGATPQTYTTPATYGGGLGTARLPLDLLPADDPEVLWPTTPEGKKGEPYTYPLEGSALSNEDKVDNYRDFLAAQFDAKKRRGENVGDIDTYITQGLISKANAIKTQNRIPTGSEKFPVKPANYGPRHQAEQGNKSYGWLGPQPTGDGVMTEATIGVTLDGKETDIPLILPHTSRQELQRLQAGQGPTPEMTQKAVEWARKRRAQGLSPYAEYDERGIANQGASANGKDSTRKKSGGSE